VLPQVSKLKRIALDLLFPQWCIGCGREGEYICHNCRNSLPRVLPPVCMKCGKPQAESGICSECAEWDSAIDGVRSPFIFEGVIRRAIHELKYHNLRALVPLMAQFLYEYYLANPLPGDIIIPVPLHRKRLNERGYNQSARLARELGRLTAIHVNTDILARKKHTAPQVRTASVTERRENVAGAFSCTDNTLQGKSVMLIDDVTTSGSTLDACAAALKAAGAASVWGLTVAIEP
jgi:ComF family protein